MFPVDRASLVVVVVSPVFTLCQVLFVLAVLSQPPGALTHHPPVFN